MYLFNNQSLSANKDTKNKKNKNGLNVTLNSFLQEKYKTQIGLKEIR